MPGLDITSAINLEIRARMIKARINQKDLADRLQLAQPAVSKRLTGQTDWRLGELAETADALGVPLSVLINAAE